MCRLSASAGQALFACKQRQKGLEKLQVALNSWAQPRPHSQENPPLTNSVLSPESRAGHCLSNRPSVFCTSPVHLSLNCCLLCFLYLQASCDEDGSYKFKTKSTVISGTSCAQAIISSSTWVGLMTPERPSNMSVGRSRTPSNKTYVVFYSR